MATTTAPLTKLFASKDLVKSYAQQAKPATSPPADALLHQAGLSPPSEGRYEILDNACGTGVVTTALYEAFKGKEGHLKLVCGDFSAQMIECTKERIAQMEGLNAEAKEMDGQAMDLPTNHFTHVLTNFGFQSFPDPLKGLRESIRVAKPGGTIGMTNWAKPGWFPAFRLALTRIPGAPTLPDPLPFMTRGGHWFDAAWTRQLLEEMPEIDPATIRVEEHAFTMPLKDEEDIRMLVTMLEKMFVLLNAQWSEEEKKACEEGRLVEAMVQAMIEEPNLVWESVITTAHKRA